MVLSFYVKFCKYFFEIPKVFRFCADIHYISNRGVFMSNFTVNGVYSYTSANIYSYLGRVPTSNIALQEAFRDYGIRPTGTNNDLKRLKNAMYEEYSTQVKEQINNQKEEKNEVPWAGLLSQIGIQPTGDYDKDYAAFNNAIQLLSQSAIDGQAMAYFAGLRSEAQRIFGNANPQKEQEPISFYEFEKQRLS